MFYESLMLQDVKNVLWVLGCCGVAGVDAVPLLHADVLVGVLFFLFHLGLVPKTKHSGILEQTAINNKQTIVAYGFTCIEAFWISILKYISGLPIVCKGLVVWESSIYIFPFKIERYFSFIYGKIVYQAQYHWALKLWRYIKIVQ